MIINFDCTLLTILVTNLKIHHDEGERREIQPHPQPYSPCSTYPLAYFLLCLTQYNITDAAASVIIVIRLAMLLPPPHSFLKPFVNLLSQVEQGTDINWFIFPVLALPLLIHIGDDYIFPLPMFPTYMA